MHHYKMAAGHMYNGVLAVIIYQAPCRKSWGEAFTAAAGIWGQNKLIPSTCTFPPKLVASDLRLDVFTQLHKEAIVLELTSHGNNERGFPFEGDQTRSNRKVKDAIRYLEAIALPSTEAPRIAKKYI